MTSDPTAKQEKIDKVLDEILPKWMPMIEK